MEEKLSKARLLSTLRTERSQWEGLLAQVGADNMTAQLPHTWWSVKDVIAHITWHEQQTIEMLQPATKTLPARDWLWAERRDKRNAILFTEFRDLPLAQVLADSQRVHQQLIAAVEATREEDVHAAQQFPGMTANWQPWQLVATHSYELYREYEPVINELLATLHPPARQDRPTLAGVA